MKTKPFALIAVFALASLSFWGLVKPASGEMERSIATNRFAGKAIAIRTETDHLYLLVDVQVAQLGAEDYLCGTEATEHKPDVPSVRWVPTRRIINFEVFNSVKDLTKIWRLPDSVPAD